MSIDELREILAEVYDIKTEVELDEAIRKMKKPDISLFTAVTATRLERYPA